MLSGRRERIVISCVTFETVRITNPIRYYEATRVHLIHYIRDPTSEAGRIYKRFYDRVVELIKEYSEDTEIIEHMADINDFSVMMREVTGIIENEKKSDENFDIFVNVTSGPSEYAAAATLASMMYPETLPFCVRTKKYTSNESVEKMYFRDGVPIGIVEETYDPKVFPKYSLNPPEKHLVCGLRILNEMNTNGESTKSPNMVRRLKEEGLWLRDEPQGTDEMVRKKSEAVYYYRDFVSKWMENEWVYHDTFKKKYFLTDRGKMMIRTFYPKDIA